MGGLLLCGLFQFFVVKHPSLMFWASKDLIQDLFHFGRSISLPVFDRVFQDLARLGHKMHVEFVSDFVHAMPMGIIRSHHRGTVTGTASFVMPKFKPCPFDLFVELLLGDEPIRLE